MRTFNFKGVISLLAFLGLAGFSCYWTAESLFIWQPSLTIVGAWFIAIAFYLMASICFTLMFRALDRNRYFGNKLMGRTPQFILCLIGFLVFWSVSLATNTHTLLYRASIKGVITADLTRTQGYLQGLQDNNVEIKRIETKFNNKESAVNGMIQRMIFEIDNPSALGIGSRFNTILAELNAELGTTIQKVANVGTTRSEWLNAIDYYMEQADKQLELYRADCEKDIQEVERMMNSEELGRLIGNNRIALDDISRMDGVNNDIIQAALDDLDQEYSYIKTNSQYIEFKDGDKERYAREGAIPEAREMLAIDKVWKDYLTTDKYDGHGFTWWIFVAILVDISGFIFFNMAVNSFSNKD